MTEVLLSAPLSVGLCFWGRAVPIADAEQKFKRDLFF